MAYNILALKDLTELKTRRGTSSNNTMATIMGPNFPTTEAYTVYIWNDSDVSTPDDDNIVQPSGPANGRWLKVSLDTSAVNLSVFYTKLELSTPSSGADVDWTNLSNTPTTNSGYGITDGVSTSSFYTNPSWISSLSSSKITGLASVSTSGSYNDLIDKPTIPPSQVNSDWNASSGIPQILNKPILSTVATTGSYNDLNDKPTKSSNTSSRSLNTSFQPSTTQDTLGIYSINISVSFSVLGAQTGTVFLEISPDNNTWTTITSSQLTWSGTLVIGLSLSISNSQTISAFIPKNYYARLRTAGTGTITYSSGQEIYF